MKNLFNAVVVCFVTGFGYISAQTVYISSEELINPSNITVPTLKTIMLSTGVQQLEYIEQGNPNGAPVIVLQGVTDSQQIFDVALRSLPSSLHVFTLTQRCITSEDFVDDIAAFIRKMHLGQAVIVGYYLGSFVAQNFAVRYPKLTKTLVLVAVFTDLYNPMLNNLGNIDAYCLHAERKIQKNAIGNTQLLVYEGIGDAFHWEDSVISVKDLILFIQKMHSYTMDDYFFRHDGIN